MCSGRNGIEEWLLAPGFAAGQTDRQTDRDTERLLFYPFILFYHQCQLWSLLGFTQGISTLGVTHREGSQG